jgi:two-component system response regulator AtoC
MASHLSLSSGIQGVAISNAVRDHFFVTGSNPAMRALERVITNIALTDIPILLTGESGTGKEEVAVRIHQLSPRQNEPFVKLICASLTADLLDELTREFGNGEASSDLALQGTVFFDELCELNGNSQAKLLHALPDGDAIPNARSLRARIISATSQEIEEEVRAGHFRKELYYRLKGVCLRLPPLRERKEDIPALVDFFLGKHSALLGRPRPPVGTLTLRMMQDHEWPGNIRELENVIKKLVAVGDESAALADLDSGPTGRAGPTAATEKISLKEAGRAASRQAERELIQQVLTRVRWNRKRAARELQISYKALLYKLKQMGLDGTGL